MLSLAVLGRNGAGYRYGSTRLGIAQWWVGPLAMIRRRGQTPDLLFLPVSRKTNTLKRPSSGMVAAWIMRRESTC